MPLVKSITPKIINMLGGKRSAISLILTAFCISATAQDNSPYSRFGLGDLVPNTNISTRAMGGISAGYTDFRSVNYNNPASYGSFLAIREATTKKLQSGRVIFDAGINLESRTLREPNNISKFTSSNLLFSHVQIGVPLQRNWGINFGLRPINRISYKIARGKRLYDPNTGNPIDSSITTNEGDGGTYLVNFGTGYKIKLNSNNELSLGANAGYLFGKKDISNRIEILNDSLLYNAGNFQTKTTYGNVLLEGGLQYTTYFTQRSDEVMSLTLGAFGNIKTDLNARQDEVRETFYFDESVGNVRLDSVSETRDVKGTIVYPSQYTAGFVLRRDAIKKVSWLLGVDIVRQNWNDFSFYDEKDPSLQSRTEIRIGGQIRPIPRSNYFSNVVYRLGFYTGKDYIRIQDTDIPTYGITMGFELPLRRYTRSQGNQETSINVAMEFVRRGNNDNLLKENLFRLSVGFALSDAWFMKRKFD